MAHPIYIDITLKKIIETDKPNLAQLFVWKWIFPFSVFGKALEMFEMAEWSGNRNRVSRMVIKWKFTISFISKQTNPLVPGKRFSNSKTNLYET